MKKLLFIAFLITGIASSFTGCLDTEGKGNYQTFPVIPAVVNYNIEMGTTLLTGWGEIAAPELSDVNQGDCLFTQFTINYDNQPSSAYYTATGISYKEVEQSIARIENEIVINDFNFPVEDIAPVEYNNTVQLKGRYFIYFKHQASKNQNLEYRIIASPDSIENGAQNVYLVAKKTNEVDGTASSLVNSHAFDVNNIIQLGKDTTISNVGMKYIKVNLKYFTEEIEGKPVFKNYSSTPIEWMVRL
jgi:hypothetical protein